MSTPIFLFSVALLAVLFTVLYLNQQEPPQSKEDYPTELWLLPELSQLQIWRQLDDIHNYESFFYTKIMPLDAKDDIAEIDSVVSEFAGKRVKSCKHHYKQTKDFFRWKKSQPKQSFSRHYKFGYSAINSKHRNRSIIVTNQLPKYSSLKVFNFSSSFGSKTCSKFVMNSFKNALVGYCGSIITPKEIAMWDDAEYHKDKDHRCGKTFRTVFEPLNARHEEINGLYLLQKNPVTVYNEPKLIPILCFHGNEFPYVIRDILPRLVTALRSITNFPEAKFLLDYNFELAEILSLFGLKHRVDFIFTETPSSGRNSMYTKESSAYYSAHELILPQCWPQPSLMYPAHPEMYSHLSIMLRRTFYETVPMFVFVSNALDYYSMDAEDVLLSKALKQFASKKFGDHKFVFSFAQNSATYRHLLQFGSASVVIGRPSPAFYYIAASKPGTKVIELVSPKTSTEFDEFANFLQMEYRRITMSKLLLYGDTEAVWSTVFEL